MRSTEELIEGCRQSIRDIEEGNTKTIEELKAE
jgi:hypothetical protein